MAANELAVTCLEYTRSRGPTFSFRPEIDRRNLRIWILICRQYLEADRLVDDALMALLRPAIAGLHCLPKRIALSIRGLQRRPIGPLLRFWTPR